MAVNINIPSEVTQHITDGVTITAPSENAVHDALSLKANTADLADVATSGDYNDLINQPSIPAAQVNSDWNATSGLEEILNKPSIPSIAGLVPDTRNLTINGTTYDLSADRTWTIAATASTLQHAVKAGEIMTKGQAVYVSSADGTNMIVTKASNTTEATSSKTMGLIIQNLANNGQGYVMTEGLLAGLNTAAATAGDPVWLGTAGNLIYGLINKPVAPAHLVFIGIVTRSNVSNGEIFIRVQNGFELQELHNVSITSVADNNLLQYDAATSLWKNESLATAGIQSTLESGTSIKTINGTSVLGAGDIIVGGGIAVGTTAVTSGTIGRVFFQATGDVVQQSANLFWDNTNGRLNLGAVGTNSARLDIKSPGALSTDIAFRVRNSADSADLFSVRGNGSQFIQSVPFIHAGTFTGGTSATQSLYIGYNSRGLGSSGARNVIIGTGIGTDTSGVSQTAIGHNISTGSFSTAIAIGDGATLTSNNSCVMGSESYPFTSMAIGTGGVVTSAANVQNMTFSVGGVAGGYTSNTNLSNKFFRLQSQGGSGTGNSAPIQFSVAPSGASGFTANTFVIPFEIRGDAAGLNNYQLATPRTPSASITDGYIQYSNDIVAGNAAPHFRTENGDIIKLYKQDSTGILTVSQLVTVLQNLGLLS
jgi:hypothetical protein